MPPAAAARSVPLPAAAPYVRLLDEWCRGMRRLQLDGLGPALDGGLLCPACARVHGRCADAVYPFLCQARLTGDRSWVDAAVRLLRWSDAVGAGDGSWTNEPTGLEWRGITVFSVIALGEALRHHGDLLPDDARSAWRARLRAGADWIASSIDVATSNINYPIAAATALAVAGATLADDRWRERAAALAHGCLAFITERDGLLWGEGPKTPSPRGLRDIDLGYNVEESLPNLALYACLAGDAAVGDACVRLWRAHLPFLLPDGGWDAGWCTRSFKWTWWGSRTSDGCQAGLTLLADRDPAFAEAAERNLALLARCTSDGLLAGGPHAASHGAPTCIHHTFCHAKAIAGAIDAGVRPAAPRSRDPDGIRSVADAATWIARGGAWRASISAYDHAYRNLAHHATGGALCALTHDAIGPVLACSLDEYVLAEPSNMAAARRAEDRAPLTPRVEIVRDGVTYRSDRCRDADVEVVDGAVVASGRLVDAQGRDPAAGPSRCRWRYLVAEDRVAIRIETDAHDARLRLPLIARADEPAEAHASGIDLRRAGGVVRVRVEAEPIAMPVDDRVYNPVPGFEAVDAAWAVPPGGTSLSIAIAV